MDKTRLMLVYRIIVAGSRSFDNYKVLKDALDQLFSSLIEDGEEIFIVSGTARGADQLGERYAKERGFGILRFPADWSQGKKAGYLCNVTMSNNAEACVCFWDKVSPGTRHMINIAKRKGLDTVVLDFNGEEIERWT